MNMPNSSDVPVGLHQPEKLLPATKPVTFLPSRQTSGRLASHYEELPNLRTSPRCSCTSLGYRWDVGEAHTTWTSARNTSLQQRSSLTAAQHCCPSRPPFSAMSALHRVQVWCFISRKREMMVLPQEKHEIRLKKASLRLRAQSSEFLILTWIHHWLRPTQFLIDNTFLLKPILRSGLTPLTPFQERSWCRELARAFF